jgi:serine protease Do
VKLTDRREFEAKGIGTDSPSDISLLKIHARNLPTVKRGDPIAVQVGEGVRAIGARFGCENSAPQQGALRDSGDAARAVEQIPRP